MCLRFPQAGTRALIQSLNLNRDTNLVMRAMTALNASGYLVIPSNKRNGPFVATIHLLLKWVFDLSLVNHVQPNELSTLITGLIN